MPEVPAKGHVTHIHAHTQAQTQALTEEQVRPFIVKLIPELDGPVVEYLAGLLCDERELKNPQQIAQIWGDLLTSYAKECNNEKEAMDVCQKLWNALIQENLVKAPIIKEKTMKNSTHAATSSSIADSTGASKPQSNEVWRVCVENMRPRLVPGTNVLAKWFEDGRWYDAVIESNLTNGHFNVLFKDYGEHAEVSLNQLKLREIVSVGGQLHDDDNLNYNMNAEEEIDEFAEIFAIRKLAAPVTIGEFGEKKKVANKEEKIEEKELSKKQLKKLAKERKAKEAAAKREELRRALDAKLKTAALERWLAADKSINRDTNVEIYGFNMATPDGSQELLTDATLKLAPGHRYGLIGRNGVGKTTLMRLISTYQLPGFPVHLRVVHVEQEIVGDDVTVLETVIAADVERTALLKEEAELTSKIDTSELERIKQAADAATIKNERAIQDDDDIASVEEEDQIDEEAADEELKDLFDGMREVEDIEVDDTIVNEDAADVEMESEQDNGLAEDIIDDAEETQTIADNNRQSEDAGTEENVDDQAETAEVEKSSSTSLVRKRPTRQKAPVAAAPTQSTLDPLVRLQQIYTRLREIDADGAEARARTILVGLQFSPSQMTMPTKALSGGWRMRVSIASALFSSPDVLLLDEPTNHLDFPAVLWLEDYLRRYRRALVVVSHDRTFLNYVTTDIIHLYQRTLTYYRGNYDSFERVRKARVLRMQREFDANKMRREHVQKFIDRFRVNANRAAQVQSRIKALQRMDALVEIVEDERVELHFPQPERLDGNLIGCRDVCFSFDEKKALTNPLLTNVNCAIDMDSRVGILGANGVGKSTLLNLLLGKLKPTSGDILRDSTVRISTFAQHHIDGLDLHLTPVLLFARLFPGHPPEHYRRHLGGFGVTGNLAVQEIGSLSGGQKSRVAFAVVTWRRPHLIVMDEPTNHLDLETVEALIKALQVYTGGIVVVSHDQYFLSEVANEFWGVSNAHVKRFDSFETAKKFSY